MTVTAANADDCTIEAATDKSEQFTTSVKGMVVTVTPKENTTEQAITATLTIKLKDCVTDIRYQYGGELEVINSKTA